MTIHEDNVVYFAHGKESGPWGTKITFLADIAQQHNYTVQSPDYSHTHDPDERVQHLLRLEPRARRNLVLVGSSMGGYVSAMACESLQPRALVLLAPALYFPGYESEPQGCPSETMVVHGWDDNILPVEKSLRFSRPRRAQLHIVNSGHTLNDQLPRLGRLFHDLLMRIQTE